MINLPATTGKGKKMKTIKKCAAKTFDTSTLKGIQSAERYKARLNNQYVRVTVTPLGLTSVRITGALPIAEVK